MWFSTFVEGWEEDNGNIDNTWVIFCGHPTCSTHMCEATDAICRLVFLYVQKKSFYCLLNVFFLSKLLILKRLFHLQKQIKIIKSHVHWIHWVFGVSHWHHVIRSFILASICIREFSCNAISGCIQKCSYFHFSAEMWWCMAILCTDSLVLWDCMAEHDTTNFTCHNKHNFDITWFLTKFLQMSRLWMAPLECCLSSGLNI